MKSEDRYVGIDVAKSRLDIALRPDDEQWSVPNEEEAIDTLVSRLKELEPALVVLEATGGLELAVTAALAACELPVVVVNPRQMRDFARSAGQLAKTDRLDAQVLAHFGEALQPTPRPLPDAQTQALAALLTRRRQVVAMITAEKNRLHAARPLFTRRSGAISSGCKRAWPSWTVIWEMPSDSVRCGVTKTNCSKAFPVLALHSP